MIRDLHDLDTGIWIGDFRLDEGIRVREEQVSPTITTQSGGGIQNMILLIEVADENKTGD